MEAHGNAVLSLSTKWRSGQTHYRFGVKPFTDPVKKARQSADSVYFLILQDSDGFPVEEIRVLLLSMTRIVNDKGQPVELEYFGKLPMDAQTFDELGGWTIKWSF